MNIKKILETEWPEVKDYVTMAEVVAINVLVTQPEVIDDVLEYEDPESIDNLKSIIKKTTASSEKYSEDHDDKFGYQQFENLQNLYETEFKYLWRQNNDAIYLSAELMHRIAVGHPFEEGNKRTAFLTAAIFLIVHQVKQLDEDTVAIPDLDADLLDSLEDIAEDGESLSPKELSKVYRDSLEKEIRNIVRD